MFRIVDGVDEDAPRLSGLADLPIHGGWRRSHHPPGSVEIRIEELPTHELNIHPVRSQA
jgi:hypothetical protein